nr:hypothetical protein GCM10020185_63790 [Pseudomonas brassicacearum subsp. brassicacearum]
MNAAVLGLSRSEIDTRFDDILAFANIGDFIDQPTKIYSSGMLVRLAFAVSVCVEPEILIVDEALSVGDASFQFKCLNRLEELAANGTTLLFVSHDMSMVKRFCHRVIYLRAGRVVASGSPDEMAELHLLDMRDEQRRWASGGGHTGYAQVIHGRAGGDGLWDRRGAHQRCLLHQHSAALLQLPVWRRHRDPRRGVAP